MPRMKTLSTRVLVIGAGAAGLRSAIELVQRRIDCIVVGRRDHDDAHTRLAAGGINASLGTRDPGDRWQLHAADTIREGGFVCQPRAVELLTSLAPEAVLELADWGCPFSRTADGALDQRYFGAQSYRRTCFAGDETGVAILRTLVAKADEVGVPYRERLCITRVLTSDGAVAGALGVDLDSGDAVRVIAPIVVLAAGGCTALYRRHSSRDDENLGDAMALALEAGAALRDMEFVQFHPTGMIDPPAMRGRLVTEAVRGEGGHLYNARGERFMERYAPQQMELAARDVVARANYEENRRGRGTAGGGVLLDISHVDADRIRDRLPRMYHQFMEQGIDITREPMQVAPTAHYPMGGVVVDFESGETRVPGLFAVGEATSGVHGANRLGGNSLAETLVFGRRTGAAIASAIERGAYPAQRGVTGDAAASTFAADAAATGVAGAAVFSGGEDGVADVAANGDGETAGLVDRLRSLMWDHAGIIRSGDGIRAGLDALEELRREAEGIRGDVARVMLPTAEAILRSALLREESRGAHFREDAPETNEAWQRSVICERGTDGTLSLRTEPIPPVPADVRTALEEHRVLEYHHLE